jgi:hypothetical protein
VGGIRLEKEKQAAARAALTTHARTGSLSLFPTVRSANPTTAGTVATPKQTSNPQAQVQAQIQAQGPGPVSDQSGPPSLPQIPRSVTLTDVPSLPVSMLGHRSTSSTISNAPTPSQAANYLGQLDGGHGGHGRSQSLFSTTASKLFKQRQSRYPTSPGGGETTPSSDSQASTGQTGQQGTYQTPQAQQWGPPSS